jgi:flagellar biogenesis protein FliO
MSLQKNVIPFDELAKMNENGSMAKMLAAPMLVVLAIGALIFLVRHFQRVRERRDAKEFWNEK